LTISQPQAGEYEFCLLDTNPNLPTDVTTTEGSLELELIVPGRRETTGVIRARVADVPEVSCRVVVPKDDEGIEAWKAECDTVSHSRVNTSGSVCDS
jgi:hypothetical protein